MVLPFQATGDATPGMQLSLRTKQTKSLKRGRKSKKGQKAEKKTGRNRKRNVLAKEKQGKQGSTSKEKPEKKTKKGTKKDNKEKTDKANGKNNGSDAAAAVKQERVGQGKSWRYEILPDQVYGCSNCRFIFGGCQGCWKENFKGKTAAKLREELEAKDAGTEKAKAKKKEKGGTQKRSKS